MTIDFFSQALAKICSFSLVSPARPLSCTVIINPTGGGFSIRSRQKPNMQILNEYMEKAKVNPPRKMHKDVRVIYTEGKGSCEKITNAIIQEAEKDNEPFYLIISAGGDGTHSEIMLALYNASAHVRSNIAILRLPMGTGNDGADSADLAGALDLLINPVCLEFAPAVQLTVSSAVSAVEKKLYLAFNILSMGLDAYVTFMTNKMKGKFPGDSYKLWIDIAALFYDKIYKVGFMNVRALDAQNNEILSFREKMLLLAMGASGYRSYGSQQKILPDERNVCCLKQTPLYRKLILKKQLKNGLHINNPEITIFNAHRLELSACHPILAQMDGEAILLQPKDFPVAMELTAPVIPLLKLLPQNSPKAEARGNDQITGNK